MWDENVYPFPNFNGCYNKSMWLWFAKENSEFVMQNGKLIRMLSEQTGIFQVVFIHVYKYPSITNKTAYHEITRILNSYNL